MTTELQKKVTQDYNALVKRNTIHNAINDWDRENPELVGELATHELLLNMDDDELHHHMMDTRFFNKVETVRRDILTEIAGGKQWGSIYEK